MLLKADAATLSRSFHTLFYFFVPRPATTVFWTDRKNIFRNFAAIVVDIVRKYFVPSFLLLFFFLRAPTKPKINNACALQKIEKLPLYIPTYPHKKEKKDIPPGTSQ